MQGESYGDHESNEDGKRKGNREVRETVDLGEIPPESGAWLRGLVNEHYASCYIGNVN